MAESVTRLKELLLGDEHRELGQLTTKIDALFDRAGTPERMRQSVAEVLEGAFREAESRQHKELASAVAPVIVSTIHTEIHKSADTLAESLTPRIGRMVANYVANAFKDLMATINAKLESGLSGKRWMIKVRSIMTGTPESELLLVALDRLRVDELYLIKRGSGDLIQRWEAVGVGMVGGKASVAPEAIKKDLDARSNRDAIVSGFLTAINDFAAEALDASDAGLQTLEFQNSRIYLRSSPNYLLAARCSGTPNKAVELALDEEFRNVLETYRQELSAKSNGAQQTGMPQILPTLAQRLEARLNDGASAGVTGGGGKLLTRLAAGLACLVFAWLAWGKWMDWRTESTRGTVAAQLESSPMRNYPIRIDVARGGGLVTLKGLAPSTSQKDTFLSALKTSLSYARVEESIDVLPDGAPREDLTLLRRDLLDGVEQSASRTSIVAAKRAVERSKLRLSDAQSELGRLETQGAEPKFRATAGRLRADAAAAAKDLDGLARVLDEGTRIDDLKDQTKTFGKIVALLTGGINGLRELRGETAQAALPGERTASLSDRSKTAARRQIELREDAEAVLVLADKFATEVAATERHVLLGTIAALNQRLSGVGAASPRQQLDEWTRSNAIFFSADLAYRDQAATERAFDQLAARLKSTNAVLRIVGYTDEIGGTQKNSTLASDRADKVRQALTSRGVGAGRLSVLGRVSGPNLSAQKGPNSPNRRVEFEVGFEGENAPGGG